MAIQSSYFDPADGSVTTADLAFTAVRSLKIPLTAATTTTPGAVCSVANPEGVDLFILSSVRRVTTPTGTVSATIAIGGNTNGETSATNLVEDMPADEQDDSTMERYASPPILGTSEYITATASDTLVGLVATISIQYVPV